MVLDLVHQLYTIHVLKNGYMLPCVYALLPNSKKKHTELFQKLLVLQPDLKNTLTVDFEQAAIDVFIQHPADHSRADSNCDQSASGCAMT